MCKVQSVHITWSENTECKGPEPQPVEHPLLLLDLKSTRQTYSDLQTFNRKKTSPRIAEKLLDSSSLLVETRETEPSNSEKKTGFQVLSKFFKGFQESVFVSDESFCCALVDPP